MFYPNLKPRHSVKKAKIDFTNFENSMNVEIDEALMPYKTAKKLAVAIIAFKYFFIILPNNLYKYYKIKI